MVRKKPMEQTISRLLDLLVESGLLTRMDGPTIWYKTTPEGAELLKRLAKMEGSELKHEEVLTDYSYKARSSQNISSVTSVQHYVKN